VTTSPTVAHGATFTIRVVQNASVITSGTQATVTYDQTMVQIQSVTRGKTHLAAPIFVPAPMDTAITTANKSGTLRMVATAFFPPSSVPAGNQDFLIITLKATGCGAVTFGLPVGKTGAVVLDGRTDTYGDSLKVTATGAKVTITNCVATATPTPSTSAGATPSGSASTSATPSASASAAPTTSASATSGASAVEAGTNTPTTQPTCGGVAACGSIPPAAPAGNTSGGSDGGLPLWLPLLLAIPAVVIVGLGVIRWRRPTIA
jgi:hypothetical protein